MLRRGWLFIGLLFLFSEPLLATVFGTVRGVIHDPSHRPIADAEVVLKSAKSDYTQTTKSNADGDFQFDAAPLGEYIVTFEWRERSGLLKNNFEGPDRLKGRYYDPKKSKYRITVEKKKHDLPPFELTSK